MRNLLATLGIGLVLALAGGAAALHVSANASHATTTEHGSASGGHGIDVSDDGVRVDTGLGGDAAGLDGAAGVSLPDAPAAPDVPVDLPASADVPDAPDVTGSADGTAGVTTEHGSADLSGGIGI